MALEDGLTYTMPVEVYLQSALVRGVLVTNQDRLSNFLILQQGEEVFSLKDATLEHLNGKPLAVNSDEYLIYMQEVFLIADLSPQSRVERSGLEHLYVKKDTGKALFGVGPHWVQGSIHLTPGGALYDLLVARSRFIPVTDATLLDRPDVGARTYLVNRNKIGFMTALGDSLVEFER
jgi:hypothetical protein